MRRMVIGILTVLVVLGLFFVLCTFVQRPYEKVMLSRFGELVEPTKIAYSWYFKWPTDQTVPLDTRLHLYQSNLTQIAVGREPIMVKSFAAWRISDPKKFYTRLSGLDSNAKTVLDQTIPGKVAAAMGKHVMDDVYNIDSKKTKMEDVENEVIAESNSALAEQGIEVKQVGFSRLALTPQVAFSVNLRMVEERERLAKDFRSQGQAKATALVQEGQTYAQTTRTAAEANAQKIRGEGESQALSILADIEKDENMRGFYRYWRATNVWREAMTQRTYFVITPNDPIWSAIYQNVPQMNSGPGGVSPGARTPLRAPISPAPLTPLSEQSVDMPTGTTQPGSSLPALPDPMAIPPGTAPAR